MVRALVSLVVAIPLIAAGVPSPAATEADIRFAAGDVKLAGTLLLPEGRGPFPGIVLVHGSGPGERGELRAVATRLAAAGLAVLVYDKRGSGASGGDWATSSLDDLVNDAAAAFRFLAGRPEVDAERVGYWGISQGGWVVPLAANQTPPAFAIVVTGGGLPPRVVEARRYRDIGGTAADAVVAAYFDYLAGTASRAVLDAEVGRVRAEPWFAKTGMERVIPSTDNRAAWAWVATFEPARSIRRLRVPVLVLLGAKDPLTPAVETAGAWVAALPQDRLPSRVVIVPGAGHGMRTGGHGGPFVDGYFTMQVEWLRTAGVLGDD